MKERNHLEDLVVDGRTIETLIRKKWTGSVWIGFVVLGIGAYGGLL